MSARLYLNTWNKYCMIKSACIVYSLGLTKLVKLFETVFRFTSSVLCSFFFFKFFGQLRMDFRNHLIENRSQSLKK